MPESLRCFVAIPLDEAAHAALRAVDDFAGKLRDFRIVPGALRHVTLSFLGNIAEESVDPLAAAVASIAAKTPAFEARFTKVIALPDVRRARILAAALEPAEGLIALMREVDFISHAAVGAPPPRTREPRPHVTIARAKNRVVARVDPAAAPPLTGALRVASIEIIRSRLTPQGPIYSPLRNFPLGAAST